MKGTIVKIYTREGFMQKPQIIWNLPIYVVRCVVMIVIANYKEIIRCVLFLTFAYILPMKGTIVMIYTMQGRIYAKATNDMELTHSYCVVCSDDIHSQLERHD